MNDLAIVAEEKYKENKSQRQMMTSIWCLIADEHATALEQMGAANKATEIRQLAEGVHREVQQGSFASHTIRVVVGRVPQK